MLDERGRARWSRGRERFATTRRARARSLARPREAGTRRLLRALVVLFLFAAFARIALVPAPHARAEDTPAPTPATTSAPAAPSMSASVSSDAPSPPSLTFSVVPGEAGGPWKMRIENSGDLPLRIAADPRLLVLDVSPPAGSTDAATSRGATKKSKEPALTRCILPADARPTTDEGRELVVPAKRSWSASFDPLFYCFGARERAALRAGASVTGRFGWPAPLPTTPAAPARKGATKIASITGPFVAAPVGAAVGKVLPTKEIESASFTIGETALVSVAPGATPASHESDPGAARVRGSSPETGGSDGDAASSQNALSISMPATLDVARATEIGTTVTASNVGDKPRALLFRTESLRFTVAGPAGSVACGTRRDVEAPIRELYSTIAIKGRATVAVLLSAVCPSDTFDEPGIYRVTATLDTTGASGRSIGLKTWDNSVSAEAPLLLRVRQARRPHEAPTKRPALD